jgi:hypothetical protein
VAELVDSEGEGVIGSYACGHDVGPVVVELLAKSADVLKAPALYGLESLEGVPGPLELGDPGRDLL